MSSLELISKYGSHLKNAHAALLVPLNYWTHTCDLFTRPATPPPSISDVVSCTAHVRGYDGRKCEKGGGGLLLLWNSVRLHWPASCFMQMHKWFERLSHETLLPCGNRKLNGGQTHRWIYLLIILCGTSFHSLTFKCLVKQFASWQAGAVDTVMNCEMCAFQAGARTC